VIISQPRLRSEEFDDDDNNNNCCCCCCYLSVLLPWKMLGDWFFNFLAGGNLKEDILHPTA
jgi:hypothetical protein